MHLRRNTGTDISTTEEDCAGWLLFWRSLTARCARWSGSRAGCDSDRRGVAAVQNPCTTNLSPEDSQEFMAVGHLASRSSCGIYCSSI